MKKSNRITKSVLIGAATLAAVALTPPAEGATYVDVTYQGLSDPIRFAHIGDAGNADDTILSGGTSRGRVDYTYHISKYEVTQEQWKDFLNAVATTADPHGLYHAYMGSQNLYSKITRDPDPLDPTKWIYDVDANYAKRPVVYVSLMNAKRFCNWLTNGGGSTEIGVYNLSDGNNAVRISDEWGKSGAVALPEENEWYKAAYYDPAKEGVGGYHKYSFGHANDDTISTNYANYNYSYENDVNGGNGTYRLNPVDFYENLSSSLSAYGVADMTGNVWEWTDTPYLTNRVVRGGSHTVDDLNLGADIRASYSPASGYNDYGFRVASLAPIPEPSTYGMIGGALVGLLCLLRRKRRAVAP